MRVRRIVALWVVPTLPFTIWSNNHEVAKELSKEEKTNLRATLATEVAKLSSDQRDGVMSIYSDSQNRFTILESKATGVLTAMAIVAAPATFACTGSTPSVVFGSVALLFLTSGGAACCLVLIPKRRHVLSLQNALHNDPIVDAAFCAQVSERETLRMANLVTSAMRDLFRALLLTLAAVILFVIFG